MTILFWVLIGFILMFIGIAAYVMHDHKENGFTEIDEYTFKLVESPESTGVDVCLYHNGRFESLSYVWEKKEGMWKYGGRRPWAGYAGTRETAIEISKIRLSMDAEDLKTKGKERT